jgi:hypothetical protein
MDQFTENGQWFRRRVLVRQCNGVADAKAHAEVLGADDANRLTGLVVRDRHCFALHCKVIIVDEF